MVLQNLLLVMTKHYSGKENGCDNRVGFIIILNIILRIRSDTTVTITHCNMSMSLKIS